MVTFQQLVDKCITDGPFRKSFIANPVAATESLGVAMTPPLKHALQNLDVKSIEALALAMQGPAQFT